MFDYLMPSEDEIVSRVLVDQNPDRAIFSIREAQRLCALARKAKVQFAIETGSLTGGSASALDLAGITVFSIDNWANPDINRIGIGGWIRDPEIHKRINWIYGKGVDKIPNIARLFGRSRWLFFHDSDHSYKNTLDELNVAANWGAFVFACHDIAHCGGEGTDKAFRTFAEGRGLAIEEEGNLGIAFPPTLVKENIEEAITLSNRAKG